MYFDSFITLRRFLGGDLRRTKVMKVLLSLIMIVMRKKKFLFIVRTLCLATKAEKEKLRTRQIPQAGHLPRRILQMRGCVNEGLFYGSGRLAGPA